MDNMEQKNNDILLNIEDLYVQYDTSEGTAYAVNGISFQLKRGETFGLVGETGAGKTTTALSILKLLPQKVGNISKGKIEFEGKDLVKFTEDEMRDIRGTHISMIFQDPMTSLNPVLTVGDQIAEAIETHHPELSDDQVEDRVDEVLKLVGITIDRKYEYPHQFSGGMKQRVVIAMALVCDPMLLLADEPTTALDVTVQNQVLDMMSKLKEDLNTSMIMITHDLGIVCQMCDNVAIMYAGEIIEIGSVYDIFDFEKPHHPYTKGLFGSLPSLQGSSNRLKPVDGLMPDPMDLPTGCKFHPRCQHCEEICKSTAPEVFTEGSHSIRCHLYEKLKAGEI